jgi:branched-chain amino acid transport system substrate-binding protein
MPGAAMFVKQARTMGVKVPIFGGDGLDSPELWEIAGKYADGIVVASVFHHDDPRYEVQKFIKKFKKEYNKIPDAWAAQGYDSVKLIIDAMKDAGTSVPHKVSESLRSFKNWNGVTGIHNFNTAGDVIGKSLVLKKVRNSKFEYLTKITD